MSDSHRIRLRITNELTGLVRNLRLALPELQQLTVWDTIYGNPALGGIRPELCNEECVIQCNMLGESFSTEDMRSYIIADILRNVDDFSEENVVEINLVCLTCHNIDRTIVEDDTVEVVLSERHIYGKDRDITTRRIPENAPKSIDKEKLATEEDPTDAGGATTASTFVEGAFTETILPQTIQVTTEETTGTARVNIFNQIIKRSEEFDVDVSDKLSIFQGIYNSHVVPDAHFRTWFPDVVADIKDGKKDIVCSILGTGIHLSVEQMKKTSTKRMMDCVSKVGLSTRQVVCLELGVTDTNTPVRSDKVFSKKEEEKTKDELQLAIEDETKPDQSNILADSLAMKVNKSETLESQSEIVEEKKSEKSNKSDKDESSEKKHHEHIFALGALTSGMKPRQPKKGEYNGKALFSNLLAFRRRMWWPPAPSKYMRINIENQITRSSKEVSIPVTDNRNVYEEIYLGSTIEDVRLWPPSIREEIENGTSEIVCCLVGTYIELSIRQMQEVSTKQLLEFVSEQNENDPFFVQLMLRVATCKTMKANMAALTPDEVLRREDPVSAEDLRLKESPLETKTNAHDGTMILAERDGDSLDSEDVSKVHTISFKPTGFRQHGWLPKEEHYVTSCMPVHIKNKITNRSKDLLVPVSKECTVFEAIYEHPDVRKANVRMWPKNVAQEVKTKVTAVKCQLLKTDGTVVHSYSIADMEETSTMDLYVRTKQSKDPIQLLLACDDTRLERQREIGRDLTFDSTASVDEAKKKTTECIKIAGFAGVATLEPTDERPPLVQDPPIELPEDVEPRETPPLKPRDEESWSIEDDSSNEVAALEPSDQRPHLVQDQPIELPEDVEQKGIPPLEPRDEEPWSMEVEAEETPEHSESPFSKKVEPTEKSRFELGDKESQSEKVKPKETTEGIEQTEKLLVLGDKESQSEEVKPKESPEGIEQRETLLVKTRDDGPQSEEFESAEVEDVGQKLERSNEPRDNGSPSKEFKSNKSRPNWQGGGELREEDCEQNELPPVEATDEGSRLVVKTIQLQQQSPQDGAHVESSPIPDKKQPEDNETMENSFTGAIKKEGYALQRKDVALFDSRGANAANVDRFSAMHQKVCGCGSNNETNYPKPSTDCESTIATHSDIERAQVSIGEGIVLNSLQIAVKREGRKKVNLDEQQESCKQQTKQDILALSAKYEDFCAVLKSLIVTAAEFQTAMKKRDEARFEVSLLLKRSSPNMNLMSHLTLSVYCQ
eukprot:scaffold10725_cov147-Cylindrotheca_fusiformis.AAC.6